MSINNMMDLNKDEKEIWIAVFAAASMEPYMRNNPEPVSRMEALKWAMKEADYTIDAIRRYCSYNAGKNRDEFTKRAIRIHVLQEK